MSRDKQKARPSVGAPERAEAGAVLAGHDPTTQCTPLPESRQAVTVSDFLARGRKNARSHRYLQEMTGLTNRELRRTIQAERHRVPILSDCSQGYFLPAGMSDVVEFTKSMRRRAGEINRTAALVELAAVRWLEETNHDG